MIRRLLVDGHVHIHPLFELPRFLDAAAANVAAAASTLGLPPDTPGCLLLAEFDGARIFHQLHKADVPAGWMLHATAEPESLLAVSRAGRHLLLFAGAQIRTAERLEVLALLTTGRFADELPLDETVEAVRSAGGIPVVPWGFGKWTFGRGAVMAAALRSRQPSFFLGDNGGRLRIGTPRLLREARRAGIPMLPGSDPLPFPDHENRAGSAGFVADAQIDFRAPAEGLRTWLRSLTTQPPVYGHGRSVAGFIRDQVRMQMRQRTAAAASRRPIA